MANRYEIKCNEVCFSYGKVGISVMNAMNVKKETNCNKTVLNVKN